MRYRDDNPGDLDRARAAVREWRERNPQGSAGQMLDDIGGAFDPDYAPVLHGFLEALDMRHSSTARIPGIAEDGR